MFSNRDPRSDGFLLPPHHHHHSEWKRLVEESAISGSAGIRQTVGSSNYHPKPTSLLLPQHFNAPALKFGLFIHGQVLIGLSSHSQRGNKAEEKEEVSMETEREREKEDRADRKEAESKQQRRKRVIR